MKLREALTFDDVGILPKFSDILTRSDCDLTVELGKGIKLTTPIIASPMKTVCEDTMAIALGKLGGLGIIHRFCSIEEQVAMVKNTFNGLHKGSYDFCCNNNNKIPIGAAIGVTEDDFTDRAQKLIMAGANIINLDVAHGHHKLSEIAIKYLKEQYPNLHIMSGAVCTYDAVNDLADWGADSIRCGVGSGCFVPETIIWTANGEKKIVDVQVGDYVYTHKGSLEKVINKFLYKKNEEVVVINKKIKCTKNHEFYVIEKRYKDLVNEKNIHKYAKWIAAKELTKEHMMIEVCK